MQDLSNVLENVQKPLRYAGGEWNTTRKDPDTVRLKIALVFPDTYEVGMSHLGLKILHDLLNRNPEYLIERIFAPWSDMERQLRQKDLEIFSLENHLPLSTFDIVGVSLQYELCHTNLLTILDLGKIPFRSQARDLNHPLIIGGGPCASNPEPVADFFDAILIGDGEEALPELMGRYQQARKKFSALGGRAAKEAVLREIARVRGWYVPSLYHVTPDPRTGLQYVLKPQDGKADIDGPPFPIERRFVEDLSKFPFPSESIVPTTEVIHDRVAVEVARGCLEGCRFCQAGIIYRPLRERKPSDILNSVLGGLRSSGYDDVSLTSLSTGDYRCIDPLVKTLMGLLKDKGIALSVSSLRADSLSHGLTEQIKQVRRTGFTIAPEAGTQRMRNVISKGITEKDVLDATRNAFQGGWSQLKMYFMIGLPTETMEDLDGIVELGKKALAVARAEGGNRAPEISISISTFIPKPFAPFQWCRMDDQQTVQAKQEHLRAALRKARLHFKWHEPESSYLECIFSRGDRRLSRVIERAWQLGCRFDGWTEELRMDLWQRAFEECDVNPQLYLAEIPLDAPLPWDHVNSLVRKEWLIQEFQRALRSQGSPACGKPRSHLPDAASTDQSSQPGLREGSTARTSAEKRPVICYHCGLACDLSKYENLEADALLDLQTHYPTAGKASIPTNGPVARASGKRPMPETPAQPVRSDGQRYFASYQKLGVLRFASHLDLIRLIGRTFNRAGIRLFHSRGFHPKPVFAFGPALSVGKESVAEWVEFASLDTGTEEQFLKRVNEKCPEGLQFTRWQAVPATGPTLAKLIEWAEYSVVLSLQDGSNEVQLESLPLEKMAMELEKRIKAVLQSHSLEVQRKKQESICRQDIRPGILRLSVSAAEPLPKLKMVLSTGAGRSVRPEEVLAVLLENSYRPWHIRRERLGFVHNDEILSPADYFNPFRIGAEIDLHAERTYCQQQLT